MLVILDLELCDNLFYKKLAKRKKSHQDISLTVSIT